MKKRLWMLLAALVIPTAGGAAPVKPPVFGVSGPWTKIADAGDRNNPTFGSGHNIVASGSEIYVAYSSDDVVWDCVAGCDVQIWIARSLDGGATFERNVLVARSPDYGWNGAQVAISPDPSYPGGRRLHVVWGDETRKTILYAFAPLDPSLGAFSAPAIVSDTLVAEQWARSIAADPLGGVHVIFAGRDAVSGISGTFYSRSDDAGTSFSEIAQALPSVPDGQDPAVATDAAGDVFVVARNYPGLAFWRRLAGSATWTGPVELPGITADEPSIAAFDANTIHVSGLVLGGDGTQQPAVASTSRGGASSADWTVRIVGQGHMSYGDVKPVAVAADGTVAVAWKTHDPTLVYVSRSTNGGGTWSEPAVALSLPNASAEDVNLAFDPAGKMLLDLARNHTIVFTRER